MAGTRESGHNVEAPVDRPHRSPWPGCAPRRPSLSTVTISILLYNSAEDIESCLAGIRDQTRAPDSVVILDNASSDDGLDLSRAALPGAIFERSEVNLGFAGGQNRAMSIAPAEFHLVLNPDCRLRRDFLERAVEALEGDPTAGAVSGRLLRFRMEDPEGVAPDLPGDRLDSTGMVALRNRRVLDRGSEEEAAGHYLAPAYVFGPSGAAALYRREMLEDVAFHGEFFDESFFAYREDVDLAWRALLLGWRCRYVPSAVARHRRRVAPGRRHRTSAQVNRSSVRNRWQMILKNELASGWLADWIEVVGRETAILGYLALRERHSLLAFRDLARNLPELTAKRRSVMRRRVASDAEMLAWFGRRDEIPIIP